MSDYSTEQKITYIIDKLKEIRIQQGISHQKLADKIGLHRSAISLIESHKRQPTFLNCMKIAEGLNANLDELIKETHTF